MKYKVIKNCQICNSRLYKFIDLGNQPLCDDLKINYFDKLFKKK